MPLNIDDLEAERLAQELARLTGETVTQVVIKALRERLARQRLKPDDEELVEDVLEIARHFCSMSVLETRSDDEIIGYDEHGLPT